MQENGYSAERIYGWRNQFERWKVQVLRKTHPRYLGVNENALFVTLNQVLNSIQDLTILGSRNILTIPWSKSYLFLALSVVGRKNIS